MAVLFPHCSPEAASGRSYEGSEVAQTRSQAERRSARITEAVYAVFVLAVGIMLFATAV